MDIAIFPPDELADIAISLPLSKSVSNRLIILQAMAGGTTDAGDVADCDDTRAMLRAIGLSSGTVDIGAAGTAMRFLTAYYATTPGCEVTLTGSERMLQRPIGPLVEALRACGAEITYAGREGFPPLRISGRRLKGGKVSVDSGVSSQFISALMMAGPTMTEGIDIALEGEPVSAPYIRMTARMLEQRGADVTLEPGRIAVAPGALRPLDGRVEADWSAASYWYEIEALNAMTDMTLRGLTDSGLQGDSAVKDIFAGLGVITQMNADGATLTPSPEATPRFTADMTDTPDLVQTVVVTCALLGVPFSITGVRSLRIKETDRTEALRRELLKIGVMLTVEGDDRIDWSGARRPITEMPAFDTYDDHRMAMALAPVALYLPGIVIRHAEVVSKSYPGFFNDMATAGFTISEVTEAAPDTDTDTQQ